MKTTWRVIRVTETEGQRIAELRQVSWFKRNPAYDEALRAYDALVERVGQEAADEQSSYEGPLDEFIDSYAGDDGAEFIEETGTLTIDVTESSVHPGAAVDMRLSGGIL